MKTKIFILSLIIIYNSAANAQEFDCESLGRVKKKDRKKQRLCTVKNMCKINRKGFCVRIFGGGSKECKPNNKCLKNGGKCFNPFEENCEGKSNYRWCKGSDCSCCIPGEQPQCKLTEACKSKGGECLSKRSCQKKYKVLSWDQKSCLSTHDCGCCVYLPKPNENEPNEPNYIETFDFDSKKGNEDGAENNNADFGYNQIVYQSEHLKTMDIPENQCVFNWENKQKIKKGFLSPCKKSFANKTLPCPKCKKPEAPATLKFEPPKTDDKDAICCNYGKGKDYHPLVDTVAYNNDPKKPYLRPRKMIDWEALLKVAGDQENFHPRFTQGYTPKQARRELGVIWENGKHDSTEDDRVEISNCNRHPYNKVVRILYEGGGVCTGTFVGPKHILTAGHCLHEDPNEVANAGWLDVVGIVVTPCGTSTTAPTVEWSEMRTVVGWTRDGSEDWDYGLITLRDKDTNGNRYSFGWMSYGYNSKLSTSFTWNLNGFPVDCPWSRNPSGLTGDQPTANSCWWDGWELAHDYDATHSMNSKQIYHLVDTQGGQSGSGLYAYWPSSGKRVIYGVHYGYYGSVADYNGARRIDKNMFHQLCGWISDNRVC